MKTASIIAVLAVLLTSASPCFALWGIVHVSKEDAKGLGMEVRSEPAGPNQVSVELEIKTDGALKRFEEGISVGLQVGDRNNPSLTARLQEDRSKPGRIVVRFAADRTQLDKLALSVRVPLETGGQIYELRVKDFIEPKKGR